jgi:hypothetical protein
VSALEELVKVDDINVIKKRVSMIRLAFNEIQKSESKAPSTEEEGDEEEPGKAEPDPLNLRFDAAFGSFKEKRAKQAEELEKQKQQNLEAKNAILEELRVLVSSEESLKVTYDKFRELQQQWKEIGIVPRTEVSNLWQNYHFLVEKFFDKVRINKELRDLDLKKNLEEKISLCEKAEELLLETSITRSFKMLQQYHQEWKAIGPVPHEYKDEIWERFKSTTEKINVRRREHYLQSREEQEANLGAKQALCDKMDELLLLEHKNIKDWNNSTDLVKEFFKLWKSIGPAPGKENDSIWERFKASVDRFYAEKSEYFGKLKEEQTHNYNLKLDICAQAEALKDSSDWKDTTHALINLQKEWKNIGPVPRRHADKIWKRFRGACDEFFKRKSEFFANIKDNEKDNLEKKEALVKEVDGFAFSDDKVENLNVLKDFQRKWMDIGHVPIKEKDRIQAAFREVIDKRMEELRISSSEIAEMNYKSRLERLNESPDANRLIGKERQLIQNKISKMQSDIILWENNLGFLASSKKADLLKKEFENKIEKAKNEVALLKAKLRVLRDS